MTVLTVSRKKPASTRRTFNMSNDLYLKLRKVAWRERLNATQQLERALDRFFADYEKENKIKVDSIEIPVDDETT
uniref:Uncharacterized protein n=1 Tax=Cyanothece sp. (strain PCC 7425 / ATCC 29141) TaxID=395961 RepID=B8HMU8_CYAP4